MYRLKIVTQVYMKHLVSDNLFLFLYHSVIDRHRQAGKQAETDRQVVRQPDTKIER